jgi:putative nucleotidyltransferase with HDIG domain
MCIKSVDVLFCNEGDVLATDIYGKDGCTLLITKDTVLNDYIKNSLMKHGVHTINIYDTKADSELVGFTEMYISTVNKTKNIFRDIITTGTVKTQQLIHIVDQIYGNINRNQEIIKCMSCVRRVDEYTYIHSVNVAFYSMMLAKWLNLSDAEINEAILAGLLHDVGKMKVPQEILNKTAKLSKDEFEIIKQHTLYGYELVRNINGLSKKIKKAVLLHHERMDGSGYPFGCRADKLNIYTRIVAIADVFDAMTAERVYKSQSTPFEAFEMFQNEGPRIFDIGMLNTFMSRMPSYLTGIKVLLSNGEAGDIVFVPLQSITCPIIKIKEEYIDLSSIQTIKIDKLIQY